MVATTKQNWMALTALFMVQTGSGSEVESMLRASTKTHVDTYVSDTRASMKASLQLIARIVYTIMDEIASDGNTWAIKSRLQSNAVTKAAIESGSRGFEPNQVADLLVKHAKIVFEAKSIMTSSNYNLDHTLYYKLIELSSIDFKVKGLITNIIPSTGDSDVVDLAKAWNTIIETRTPDMYNSDSGWTDAVFSKGNGIGAFVIFTILAFHSTLPALIEDRSEGEWEQVDSIIQNQSFAKLAMPCATSRTSNFIMSENGAFDTIACGIHRTAIQWINHQRGSCDRTCQSIDVTELTREMAAVSVNVPSLRDNPAPPLAASAPPLASSSFPVPTQQFFPAAADANVDGKSEKKGFLKSLMFGKKK